MAVQVVLVAGVVEVAKCEEIKAAADKRKPKEGACHISRPNLIRLCIIMGV